MNIASVLTILGIASLSAKKSESGSKSVSLHQLIRVANTRQPNDIVLKTIIASRSLNIAVTEDLRPNMSILQTRRILLQDIEIFKKKIINVLRDSNIYYRGFENISIYFGGFEHTSWRDRKPGLINQELMDAVFGLLSELPYQSLKINSSFGYNDPRKHALKVPKDFLFSRLCDELEIQNTFSVCLDGMRETIGRSHNGQTFTRDIRMETIKITGWSNPPLTLNLDLSEFKKLKSLEVRTDVKNIRLPKSIEEIKLSNLRSTSVPKSLYHAKNLKKVVIWANSTKFSDYIDFSRSKNLRHVEIIASTSRSKKADPSVVNPKMFVTAIKLETLILKDLGLEDIPDIISNARILTKVSFAGNNLSTLPASMFVNSHIEDLNISRNRFVELPFSFWIFLLTTKTRVNMISIQSMKYLKNLVVPPYEFLIRSLEGKRVYASGRKVYLALIAMNHGSETEIRRY